MAQMDKTHDGSSGSWVSSANAKDADFPIQNLPLGVIRRCRTSEVPRGAVAIGDQAIDLRAVHEARLLGGAAAEAAEAAAEPSLNRLMSLGPRHRFELRRELWQLLLASGADEAERRRRVSPCLIPLSSVDMLMPAAIGDYSDFYAGIHHARNMGKVFRPDNPLLPNYRWVPIGYHGRASSVMVSGTPVRRPNGQFKKPDMPAPQFGPCQQLDYELELGLLVATGNAIGTPVSIDAAPDHFFGVCLLNDWSARDVQAWEYQPLGPFLAKSFATSISPWIVTMEALAPFRIPAFARPGDDPVPLPHLTSPVDQAEGGIDLRMEVLICTERMREAGAKAFRLTDSNFRHSYWTPAQMLAHHTSNGCNLNPGDLFGSGTMSGTERSSFGSLIEITSRGKEPVRVSEGETRTFLEDGDEIIFRGRCERSGYASIGLGECRGIVLPAPPPQ
jgi:fumarylacetoacetase